MKLVVALPAPVRWSDSFFPLSRELCWLSGFSFASLRMAWRVLFILRAEKALLRTTILEETAEQRWTLQGRLSGPWVAHLKSDWQKSHCRSGKRKCVVDVSGVTFVDLEGEQALEAMMNDGAEFIATGVYTRHVLEMLERRRQRWIRKC